MCFYIDDGLRLAPRQRDRLWNSTYAHGSVNIQSRSRSEVERPLTDAPTAYCSIVSGRGEPWYFW